MMRVADRCFNFIKACVEYPSLMPTLIFHLARAPFCRFISYTDELKKFEVGA